MASSSPLNREEGYFEIKDHEVLSGTSGQYRIEKFLGKGIFGQVAMCLKLDTKEKMAVKIVRKDLAWAGKEELAMLQKLGQLDEDKNNLVRLMEHFKHNGYTCLVFEKLDMTLDEFMNRRLKRRLCLDEIRVITQQMLVALKPLSSIGLAHTDIKPDNVMLVNHGLHPLKVKLIDLGLTRQVFTMSPGTIIQPLAFRAPEVILGLRLNEAVDMWSLGCLLAFMYLGRHLYASRCPYQVMRVIVQLHGQPNDQLLDSGINTKNVFCKEKDSHSPSWRLYTRDEYQLKTGYKALLFKNSANRFTRLADVTKTHPEVNDVTNTSAFLSLLKLMFHVDPEKTITASEALGHRFITMNQSSDTNNKLYVPSAHSINNECQQEQSAVVVMPSVRYIEEWSGASTSNSDDSPSAGEETVAGTKHEPPATADRNAAGTKDDQQATAAGTYEKPPGTNDAAESTGFVEVKTRKKYIKKARQFFSRMFTSLSCCSKCTISE